jgi:hypothetical protein
MPTSDLVGRLGKSYQQIAFFHFVDGFSSYAIRLESGF